MSSKLGDIHLVRTQNLQVIVRIRRVGNVCLRNLLRTYYMDDPLKIKTSEWCLSEFNLLPFQQEHSCILHLSLTPMIPIASQLISPRISYQLMELFLQFDS